MNTAETDLATKILNAAAATASRQDAGNTLLFVEAYDKILRASFLSHSANVKDGDEPKSVVKNGTFTGLDNCIHISTRPDGSGVIDVVGGEKVLPVLGEPTPIQPIPAPAKRNRRTQAQIEADNAAAAQATAPGNEQTTVTPPDSQPTTGEIIVKPTNTSETPSTTESDAPPEGIDGITLSTLFKTILSSKEEPDKTTFKNAVRAKLEAVGIPQISKLTPEHFESFNTFLLSFKA